MAKLTAAILAGGRARRLKGRSKGLIPCRGQTIIECTLELVDARSDDVFLVGQIEGPYQSLGRRIVTDIHSDKGAPAGLHAALTHARHDWVMVLPCDLPEMTKAILDELQPSEGHDAVLYRVKGRTQPLVGMWHRRILDHLDQALSMSDISLNELTTQVSVKWLESDDEKPFFNLNTASDLARLKNGCEAGLRAPYQG